MKPFQLIIPAFFLATLMLAPSVAGACNVNGGAYTSIQDALDDLGSGANISVSGICAENVIVSADDVRIEDGTIDGSLAVVGAQRFYLGAATVTNSNATNEEIGILVTDGASAEINTVVVTGMGDNGIDVRWGSFARILSSHVHNNGFGLVVNKGGVVDSFVNVFEDNAEGQVDLAEHGTYRGSGDEITQGTGNYAIWVDRNSYGNLRSLGGDQSTVTGMSYSTNQSHFRTRDKTTFAGNISVDIQSSLDLAGETSVEGDVTARNLSTVQIRDDATVDGNVRCMKQSICI